MKIVITASGDAITNQFDMRFGRASWFCVYDDELQKVLFVENSNIGVKTGAGIMAAETMVALGVKKVISGDFGFKGKEMLDKFEVQMVVVQEEELLVGTIIERLKTNKNN